MAEQCHSVILPVFYGIELHHTLRTVMLLVQTRSGDQIIDAES